MSIRYAVSLLLAGTLCSAGIASPKWKASSLAKALREADAKVERTQDRQELLAKFSKPNQTEQKEQYDRLIDAIREMSLFTEAQQTKISPVSINANPDGSATLFATWARDIKDKSFYSKKELETIAEWNRRQREGEKKYNRQKTSYRNVEIVDDPAKTRNKEIEEFNTHRQKALKPIEERAALRSERYSIVKLELAIHAELAQRLDHEALLGVRIVPALFQPTDCELDVVDPEFDWPPFVSSLRAELLDLDPSALKRNSEQE